MNKINMIGQSFGNLTVIEESKRRDEKGRVFWVCKCNCGNLLEVRGDNLRRWGSTQCSECTGCGRESRFVGKEGD